MYVGADCLSVEALDKGLTGSRCTNYSLLVPVLGVDEAVLLSLLPPLVFIPSTSI